jgi:hypothetical protein
MHDVQDLKNFPSQKNLKQVGRNKKTSAREDYALPSCEFPRRNWHRFDIKPMVAAASSGLSLCQLWMDCIQLLLFHDTRLILKY